MEQGHVIRQMAPLFSKADSNKLRHSIPNKVAMISARFSGYLINISKDTGSKNVHVRMYLRYQSSMGSSIYLVVVVVFFGRLFAPTSNSRKLPK